MIKPGVNGENGCFLAIFSDFLVISGQNWSKLARLWLNLTILVKTGQFS